MNFSIKILGIELFAFRKEAKAEQKIDATYNHCSFGIPVVIQPKIEESHVRKEDYDAALISLSRRIARKTGVDASTVELVLRTAEEI